MSVDEDPFAPVEDPQERKNVAKLRNVENPGPETGAVTGEVGLSCKFGPGYEAPMFHVKAADVYTLAALVGYDGPTDVSTAKYLGALLRWWSAATKQVRENYRPGEGVQIQKEQAQARQDRTVDGVDVQWMYDLETPRECSHGTWKPVTKQGAKGRWYAWGCPGGKDNSCSKGLEFVDKPKS